MNTLVNLLTTLSLLLCLIENAPAQYLQPFAVRLDVSKYFDEHKPFIATAELIEGEQKIVQTQPNLVFKFAYLNGMTRSEVDMSEWQDPQGHLGVPVDPIRPEMRKARTEQVITIVKPREGLTFWVYPKLKSYIRMEFKGEAAKQLKTFPQPKSSTELGKETLMGHPSVKFEVTFAEEGPFERQEVWGLYAATGGKALLWKATDLDNLPIKFQGQTGIGQQILTFKDLKPGKPNSKLFEPPSGFSRYDSMEAFFKAKVKLK